MAPNTTFNGHDPERLPFTTLAGTVATDRHETGTDLSVRFDCGPAAAYDARAALEALDQRLDPQLLDDVRLLVSELVTNAIRHAGAPVGAHVGLDVSIRKPCVRVEVADPGAGFVPAPRVETVTKPGGWGLYLVDRIADRWGIVRNRMNRVWFEIDATVV
jgi:anti-sigma regulatory factor (Ser/Thr protein kinase)